MPVRHRSIRPTARQAASGLLVLGLTVLLSGCGGGGAENAGPPTVTVTPTVTASGAPDEADTGTPTTSPTTAAAPASDVKGRGFDLGTITSSAATGGVTVIELDRWTVRNLDDAKLATDGYPVRLLTGTPFLNQNDTANYAIPVAADATVLYHHCAAATDPMQTRSATVEELAALKAPENVVVAELDADGQATSLQNYPVCAS